MLSHCNHENTDQESVILTAHLLESPIRPLGVSSTILPRAVGLHHYNLELAKLPKTGVQLGEGSLVHPTSQRLRGEDGGNSLIARRSGSRRTCTGGGHLSGLMIPQTPRAVGRHGVPSSHGWPPRLGSMEQRLPGLSRWGMVNGPTVPPSP
ncbi:hypothetical protein M231_03492 [Tremella mesenterica]|uniref:Uncharacterized protein n=1 Tax=Tremella mesenterica TaxID=5217 RepID=A0A4Q1BNH8_TREME|nr:hypothetical protein M231_03492 [Tremella mesenterica]